MNETTTPPGNAQAFSITAAKFSDINQPGVWVDQTNGTAYRVFPEGLKVGHSPLIDVPTARNLILVNTDPATLYDKIRLECSNSGVSVRPMPN
ncbi:MAG: hypothetical protein G01um101420_38 [Parcubacteria group bacterium Gr01-1014_20]|nr:MAG: hypothetical protein G01um101420_38 [Parcubacteria group bacterium Gr01-1014_20]